MFPAQVWLAQAKVVVAASLAPVRPAEVFQDQTQQAEVFLVAVKLAEACLVAARREEVFRVAAWPVEAPPVLAALAAAQVSPESQVAVKAKAHLPSLPAILLQGDLSVRT